MSKKRYSRVSTRVSKYSLSTLLFMSNHWILSQKSKKLKTKTVFLFAGIGRTLIPRYFRSIFEGGVTDMRYELRHPKESFHNTSITMDCDQCVVATLHGKPMFTKVPIKEVYLKKVVFLTYSSSIFYLMSAAPRRI